MITTNDLAVAMEPVVRALESLGVIYYVGGSVASPVYGVPFNDAPSANAHEMVAVKFSVH